MAVGFIPTVGAVRVDIMFTLAGQQIHNIIWAAREAAWTQAQREALAEAIETWWGAELKSKMSSQIALAQITVVNQDTASSPSSVRVVSPTIPGTNVNPAVTAGTALCATLRTDLRGRNYRGRMYLAGLPRTEMNDAVSTGTGILAQIIAALMALKTVIEGLGAVWVVVSKWLNKVPRAGGTKTPITAVSIDQYVDSQRRRLGLRGV